jgi:PAS domain S-box-containing protein
MIEGHDLDELIQTRKELEELRARSDQQAQKLRFAQSVLAALNISFVITDVRQPDQPIIYVSKAFEALTGYSAQEAIGQNCRFLQRDDHRQPALADIHAAISSGTGCTAVLRNYRKDGTAFWNEVVLAPLYDQSGVLTHYVGSQTDITRRKTAEETLQTTRDQLQAILDNSITAIFIKDLSGCYIMANTRFYQMTGLDGNERVEGRYDFELFSPEQAEHFRLTDQQVLIENRELELEETYEQDEQQVTNLTVKFPLRDADGQPYAIGGIATDITIRKRSEVELQEALKQQQELNELKTRFVSMASHEFRTPLATILATAETIRAYRSKMNDDEIDRRLGKIKEQVEHLRSIMDDVLQLTRIQAGYSEFDPAAVNFDEFCQDIVSEFLSQPDFNHPIVFTCDQHPLPAVLDQKLMRKVLSNLISNAVKYSSPGKNIGVDVARDDTGLSVRVRDEGIGIPQDDLKHLFEPFFRASNVGAVPGTGLGLAITMQSVQLHDGSIHVETQEGIGTTFTIQIPQTEQGI